MPASSIKTLRSGSFWVLLWPLLALAALLLYNAFFTDGFFHLYRQDGQLRGILIDILKNGAPVILVALGMTLVLATGGVDLSVGAVMVIAGAKVAMVAGDDPTHAGSVGLFFSAILLAMGLALLAGIWNGFLVSIMRVQPIVATLILMVAGRGIARLITNETNPEFKNTPLLFLGKGIFLGLPFPIWIAMAVFALLALVIRQTAMALFIESIGDNEVASRYAGLSSTLVKFNVYVVAALCAGLAGIMSAANVGQTDTNTLGLNMELDAILAAVIGGTSLSGGRFYLLGSVLGGLLIQTMTTTMIIHNVPPPVIPVPKSLVIILVCLLQSPVFRAQMASLLPRRTAR